LNFYEEEKKDIPWIKNIKIITLKKKGLAW
jgi:hypothetical protein